VAERQAEQKSDSNNGAKFVLIGTIVAAIIGAIATITAALLQRRDSFPIPPSLLNPKVLDKTALEGDNGVKKILVGTYGIQADQIQSLNCPGDEEVKAGNKFACTVTLSGDRPGEQVVDIVILDDNGQYQVGQPHYR